MDKSQPKKNLLQNVSTQLEVELMTSFLKCLTTLNTDRD